MTNGLEYGNVLKSIKTLIGDKAMKSVILVVALIALLLGGCESMKVDGVSFGAAYFNANVPVGRENVKIEGLMPMALVNIKFE